MPDRPKILTWYWQQPGGRVAYTADHVNIWADSVRRHLSRPHRLAVVTDIPQGIDSSIEIIAPPREFEDWRIPSWGAARPQCLRRITMFRRDAGALFGADTIVCMDLDCVVAGPLDPLFDTDAGFKMFRGTAKGRPYNGSMMLIRAGTRPQVYDSFTLEAAIAAGTRFVGSDQAWISQCLGPHEATWGPEDGVHFWDGRTARNGECRIMFFPGSTKPWRLVDCGETFCTTHYRRNPTDRTALILGYGARVWEDAAAALRQRERFDAVIASPEAAAHLPGTPLAIAEDDDHARRIADMHGFSETVFCGRTREERLDVAA